MSYKPEVLFVPEEGHFVVKGLPLPGERVCNQISEESEFRGLLWDREREEFTLRFSWGFGGTPRLSELRPCSQEDALVDVVAKAMKYADDGSVGYHKLARAAIAAILEADQ